MTDDQTEQVTPKPTRAQQRRAEEFERLCNTGYTVCCGGGGHRN